jgi:predicted DNA-binding transcriptional regulator YafY
VSIFPQLERLVWLHQQIKTQRYPNSARLAERFEVSEKTARRDIALLRDRFNAPLAFDRRRNGYLYDEPLYELPCLPAGEQEVLCLLMARRLLDRVAGGFIERELSRLQEKIFSTIQAADLSPEDVAKSFSATWCGHAPAHEASFRQTTLALLRHFPLEFRYRSPISDRITQRIVEPHHLQYYMANWVLVAWCRTRADWRKFLLTRMDALRTLETPFQPRPEAQWRPLLESAFGLFQGHEAITVILRFTPFRSRWIREQLWHPAQRVAELADGGLELTLPVADFREIKMRILQFGADCEVVAPEALKAEVRLEIERMGKIYG